MLRRWAGKKARGLSQALVLTLVATAGFLSPFAPLPSQPAFATGDPGWDSEIDYAGSFNRTQLARGPGTSGNYTPVIPASDNTFTVEAWFKVRARQAGDDTYPAIFGQNQPTGGCTASRLMVSLHWDNTTGYALHTAQDACGDFFGRGRIPVGEWAHVAYVSNATSYSLFLNGSLLGTVQQNMSAVASNAAPFTIGGLWNPSTNELFHTFPGEIDQVKVWSSVLSEADIRTSMHSLDSAGISGLERLYTFNSVTQTIHDHVGTADLSIVSNPSADLSFTDVKSQTTLVDGDVVFTFPRTYLPGKGGWTRPSSFVTGSALVVAGGGAGGNRHGGGGGAGAVAISSSVAIPNTVSIVVGQGGLGSSAPTSGQASGLGNFSAPGGGRGGGNIVAQSGGSSGGSPQNIAAPTITSPANSFGYTVMGNVGGAGFNGSSDNWAGGGGGGAVSAGSAAPNNNGGAGGQGFVSSISGTSLCYGAGGGGGIGGDGANAGAAGTCAGVSSTAGAGSKGVATASSALANSGSGGGGAGYDDPAGNGTPGSGGSGVVIIRYTPINTLTFVSKASNVGAISAISGSAVTQPPIPTTTSESVFLGWTTVDGNRSTLVSWPYTLRESITLYGFWVANPGMNSEIDYALDPGSGVGGFGTDSGQVIPGSSSFTIEVWLKPDSLPNQWNQVVHNFAGNNFGRFDINVGGNTIGSNQIQVIYNPRTSDAVDGKYTNLTFPGLIAPIGEWTHIAVSIVVDKPNSSYTMNVFRNGYLAIGPIVVTGITFQNMEDNFYVGHYAGQSRTFDGQIDQLKVWDAALTQTQVEQSMHVLGSAGVSGTPALRAHYDFNEAPSTTTVTDRTLSGRNLNQVGTPTRVDTKQSITANGVTTLTFPRTYLPGVGGWTPPSGVTNAELLLVGGGGGSAGNSSVASFGGAAGSGGGGGVFRSSSVGLAAPSVIKVGAGGLGGRTVSTNAGASGNRGQTSSFRDLTAGGGGAGGCEADNAGEGSVCATAAASGGGGTAAGSGGSPSNFWKAYSPGFAGTAAATVMDGITYPAVPGNKGGFFNQGGTSTNNTAGSAGGAGGAGSRNAPGAGLSSTISGNAVTYGAGGASWNSSSWVNAAPAANRGTGGNGPYSTSAGIRGYDGSAGLVILRYTVATSPVITAQPQTVSATPGSTANFSVTATGNGTLSYQWQESSDGTNWQNVGLNQNTHSLSNVAFASSGRKIRVVVTNTINGSVALTSDVATMNVTGVTLTVGACSAMVANPTGVTVSEAANGGCLVQITATGPNTFFVPTGVTSVEAFLVGGGGGGGAARLSSNRGGGGGGGGGGANVRLRIPVTTSQELAVSIGAGGAGGTNANGASGSATTLLYGTTVSSTSVVASGGQGGGLAGPLRGASGRGGASTVPGMIAGAAGGAGSEHLGTLNWQRPANGNSCWRTTFLFEYRFCVGGGGGGGNRELASDPFFNYVAVSTPFIGTNLVSGGSGGYHNGTAVVAPTSGVLNTGGGGGGGSYDAATSTFRSGAAGSEGIVLFAFTPGAGEISLSAVAPFSFSATAKTITLTKQNTTTDVTWTTSNTAVCTVTGDASSATVTPVSPGLCEVTVRLAANAPYGRGSAVTSFRIDKITRTAPTWVNSSLSIPFGGSFDLRTNINTPGQNSYAFSTSGTAGSCAVTGYTLTVGSVGDTCNVSMTLVGDALYDDVPAASALSVTVTAISQSGLVITSGNQMNVGGTLTVSAAGGSGPGAISYHLVGDGGTGCQINSATGAITGSTAAGSCTVYAKRAASTNYDEVTSSNQVVTVNKISQVLSWVSAPQPIVLAGGQYIVEATASSQLSITYSIGSGLCTITGTTVTFTGSGDCVIRAAQSGSSGYLVAQTISQTVSVGKVNQTMTFSSIANVSWGSLAFSLSATASSGLTIGYTKNIQTTNDACDVSAVGVVTIKNIGFCAITATQAGDSAYTSVAATQVFEVTPNPAGAPFIGSISFGDRQLNASFFTPSYLGGGTITAYELRAYKKFDGSLAAKNSGCIAQPGATQTCSVNGLENGEGYILRAAAITQAGLGQLSASSSEIVPAANPEAVSNLVAIEGNAQLTIRWSPAASLGGGTFDQYRIFWRAPGASYQSNGSPGATVGNLSSTSYTITGLQNGVAYDVKVTTVTSINTLELQSNTAEVRQTPFTVPDAPAAVATFDNGAKVLVAWQAPVFDGGNPIDQYVVTKDGATVCSITSVSSTSCEVTKPTSGTSTIEVKAGNDAGLSLGTQATFTVFTLQVTPGSGGVSTLPTVNTSTPKPVVTSVDGPRTVAPSSSVSLRGENFLLVQRVLVEGVETSFVVSSDNVLTLKLPAGLKAGEVSITFLGAFGTFILSNFITITPVVETSISSRVTIGSFNGFAAVYTKNLEGKRLSMKFGNKWRVVSKLPANYTLNLFKSARGKTLQTMVYIDRKLVKISNLRVR